ncbi:MAG: DNA mismatch repair endonuclease MutL [Desulfobacterales bacterium]
MSQIKILPELLSNKIAAGEVVERPAAVVKELVENALDAGSTRVVVDVEKGGRSLIRVSDNGTGMGHDDALLALERYATSKIFKDRDLFSINTLGFRGEALPSIAAVSRFNLTTRAESADSGTEIVVEGGKIKNVSEVGVPKGTMVTVRQLFFNTPARRKFLKTTGTEMGHIADMIARIALGNPAVQFRLTHNDKIVKNWSAASKPFDRMVDVLGNDLKNSLHGIEFQNDGISITGWISSPRATRRTSRAIFIYVNGRFVRDRIVQHALFEGYSQRLVKGQFPVAVIFISLPFDAVDVNVHPTKNEVRFARQREVHEAVRRAVAQTLYQVDRPGWAPAKFLADERDSGFRPISDGGRSEFGLRRAQPSRIRTRRRPIGLDYAAAKDAEGGKKELEFGISHPAPRNAQLATLDVHPATRNAQTAIWQKKPFGDMRVIGQFHNTYIVCESEAGLILIDQHAAHERVLFEQFSARSNDSQKSAQLLLVPETVELGYREAGVLEKMISELSELGLDIEPFGGNTFVVKAVPVLLAGREIKPVLIEIIEKIAQVGAAPGLAEALDQSRMVLACHAAIRANQALSQTQIQGLLTGLDGCRNPSHCPHGRPTWIHWEIRNLEKSFKRVV